MPLCPSLWGLNASCDFHVRLFVRAAGVIQLQGSSSWVGQPQVLTSYPQTKENLTAEAEFPDMFTNNYVSISVGYTQSRCKYGKKFQPAAKCPQIRSKFSVSPAEQH